MAYSENGPLPNLNCGDYALDFTELSDEVLHVLAASVSEAANNDHLIGNWASPRQKLVTEQLNIWFQEEVKRRIVYGNRPSTK